VLQRSGWEPNLKPKVGFTAHVPALSGCISEGDTIEEARANIREAIMFISNPLKTLMLRAGWIHGGNRRLARIIHGMRHLVSNQLLGVNTALTTEKIAFWGAPPPYPHAAFGLSGG
jgi:hypothetical protein